MSFEASLVCAAAMQLASFGGPRGNISEIRAEYICDYAEQITEIASKEDIDPLLIVAIGYIESRWKWNAVSEVGACGPMQVIPKFTSKTCKELMKLDTAVKESVRMLTKWRSYKRVKTIEQALACYASGTKCTASRYARVVMAVYRSFRCGVEIDWTKPTLPEEIFPKYLELEDELDL